MPRGIYNRKPKLEGEVKEVKAVNPNLTDNIGKVSVTTPLPICPTVLTVPDTTSAQIINIVRRIEEIENYRSPRTYDLRVNQAHEDIDSLRNTINLINARLIKIEGIIKKAYNLEEVDKNVEALSHPR
jgi:hypothetical protein